MPIEFLTTDEASDYLRKPKPTMTLWRHKRTGPPYTKIGRAVMYRRDLLDQWIKTQTHLAPPANPPRRGES